MEDLVSTPVDASLACVVSSPSLGTNEVALPGVADVTRSIAGFVVVMLISGMSADTIAEAVISFESELWVVISCSILVASDSVDCEVVSIPVDVRSILWKGTLNCVDISCDMFCVCSGVVSS